MPVFSGNTTGSVTQVAANLPSGVLSFRLANESAGTIVVNVYVTNGLSSVSVLNKDYTMDAGDLRVEDNYIRLLKGSSIHIITTGSLDFYFSID